MMVSRLGYQLLAKEIAYQNDVLLLTIKELPHIIELLAERLKTVALPDENLIGEPFWTIMEIRNGKTTGSFFAHQDELTKKNKLFLFYSKKHAEYVFESYGIDSSKYAIRGMPQYVFRAFLIQLKHFESYEDNAVILFPQKGAKGVFGIPATSKELIEDYYHGKLEI